MNHLSLIYWYYVITTVHIIFDQKKMADWETTHFFGTLEDASVDKFIRKMFWNCAVWQTCVNCRVLYLYLSKPVSPVLYTANNYIPLYIHIYTRLCQAYVDDVPIYLYTMWSVLRTRHLILGLVLLFFPLPVKGKEMLHSAWKTKFLFDTFVS